MTKEGRNTSPRFSPDSRRILYRRDYGLSKRDVFELHVMDVDGSNDHVVFAQRRVGQFRGGVLVARRTPGGRHLDDWEMLNGERVRRAGEASKFRVEVMDADGKNRHLLRLADATMLQLDNIDWR